MCPRQAHPIVPRAPPGPHQPLRVQSRNPYVSTNRGQINRKWRPPVWLDRPDFWPRSVRNLKPQSRTNGDAYFLHSHTEPAWKSIRNHRIVQWCSKLVGLPESDVDKHHPPLTQPLSVPPQKRKIRSFPNPTISGPRLKPRPGTPCGPVLLVSPVCVCAQILIGEVSHFPPPPRSKPTDPPLAQPPLV